MIDFVLALFDLFLYPMVSVPVSNLVIFPLLASWFFSCEFVLIRRLFRGLL